MNKIAVLGLGNFGTALARNWSQHGKPVEGWTVEQEVFDACIDELVMVSDAQLYEAMRLLQREAKLAVEPAGAATTAALAGPLREQLAGKDVVAIVCGANIDPETYCEYLGRKA